MLNTIVGRSYGECIYAEIAEKLEKMSHNNKSQSTRNSEMGRNTITVHATNNSTIDGIREEMA